MIGYFLTTLITALSLLITDILLPGVSLANFPAAILAGIVIGLINSFVKPVLSILSLPVTILTLGLFTLVINGICFSLAAFLVPGFSVTGAVAFIVGPLVLSLASTLLNRYFVAKQTPGSASLPTDKPAETNS